MYIAHEYCPIRYCITIFFLAPLSLILGTISLTPKMLSNEKFWKLWTLYYYISFHYPKSTFYPTSVNTCEIILAKNQPKEKVFQKFSCCDDTLRILQIPLRVFQNEIMTFEVFRNLGQNYEICHFISKFCDFH